MTPTSRPPAASIAIHVIDRAVPPRSAMTRSASPRPPAAARRRSPPGSTSRPGATREQRRPAAPRRREQRGVAASHAGSAAAPSRPCRTRRRCGAWNAAATNAIRVRSSAAPSSITTRGRRAASSAASARPFSTSTIPTTGRASPGASRRSPGRRRRARARRARPAGSSPSAGMSHVSASARATAAHCTDERVGSRRGPGATRACERRATRKKTASPRQRERRAPPRRRCRRRRLRLSRASADEHSACTVTEPDRERAPAHDDGEAERRRAARARTPLMCPHQPATIRAARPAAPTPSRRGTSRIRIFARERLEQGKCRAQSTTSTTGSVGELPPDVVAGGGARPALRARARASAARRRPLQIGEVAAGVFEQRALVDHRQLEVRVGVVDRLPPGLGDDDQRERDRARAQAPGSHQTAAGRRGDHRRADRSVPATSAATREGEDERRPRRRPTIVRSRLAPISANPFPASQAAAASANRAEREQPGEREHVVADTQARRLRPATGTSRLRASRHAATTAGASR